MQPSSPDPQILGTVSGIAHDDLRAEEGTPFVHVVTSSDQSPLIDALAALVRYHLDAPGVSDRAAAAPLAPAA